MARINIWSTKDEPKKKKTKEYKKEKVRVKKYKEEQHFCAYSRGLESRLERLVNRIQYCC